MIFGILDAYNKNDDYRYHVLFVSENAVRCMTIVCGIHPYIMVWDRDLFIKQFNCIGKYKGSIDDLFEVQDEHQSRINIPNP